MAQPAALSVDAPYFWRNRSTRPAVSTSFCLPVKYGWHLAQTSTWIRGTVERVTKPGATGARRRDAGGHVRRAAPAAQPARGKPTVRVERSRDGLRRGRRERP